MTAFAHHSDRTSRPQISVVLPAYNEAENLPSLINELNDALAPYESWEILVVDDGSADTTIQTLDRLRTQYPALRYVALSRNFGHQAALRAGYEQARGECVISMDADGQHPVRFIPVLISHWLRGYEVVGTRRAEDPNLPWLKRATSRWFYRLFSTFSNVTIEPGEADFRLLDRKVIEALKQFPETDLFLRGTIAQLGFRQIRLPYQPEARRAGTTKYSLRKMIRLALSGITSFSIRPLFLSIYLGFCLSGIAGLYGLVVLYEKFFTDKTVSGWTSIVLLILLIGGAQFIVMGLIGIYVGKAFEEIKRRPSYLVGKTTEPYTRVLDSWIQSADELVLP